MILNYLRRATLRGKSPWIVSAQPHLDRANRLEKAGRRRAALREFQCAARIAPRWAEPSRKIGVLHLHSGNPRAAIPPLETACRLSPANLKAAFDLGTAFLQTDHPARALPHLERAHRLDPDDFRTLSELARAHELLGHEQEIRQLLHVDPPRLSPLWRLLSKIIPPRYAADGHVENIDLLGKLFARPIRLSVAARERAALCAVLSLRHLRGQSEYAPILSQRLAIQENLIACMGLTRAPLRYLTDVWLRNFGHITQIDFYLKLLRLGLLPPHRPVVLFDDRNQVANPCLLDYWKPHLEIIIDPETYRRRKLEAMILDAEAVVFRLPGESRCRIYQSALAQVEERWDQTGRGPLLQLDPAHRERGWAALHQAGLPRGAWFATLHVRESGFTGDRSITGDPIPSLRNAVIDNYLPAIREIAARGGWVVRIGDPSMAPLPPTPGLIDLTRTGPKSDWMDVFLLAACRFSFGSASGPASVPALFGTPSVYTDYPLQCSWPAVRNDIIIHKIYRDRATGAKIPYSRSINFRFDSREALARENLSVEDNTPEEIRDAVVEMIDRLDGVLPPDPESDARQDRLDILLRDSEGRGRTRMGRKFLEIHHDLIG